MAQDEEKVFRKTLISFIIISLFVFIVLILAVLMILFNLYRNFKYNH